MDSKNLKWIFLTILALIWGSSFILILKGLDGLSPLQLGSLRIIFATIFLLAIGFRTLSKIPLGQWKFIALTALFGTFIPAYLFAIAETKISSTISAVLNSLTPLNTLVSGILAFGLSFQRRQILGVIVGLIGSGFLIFNGAENQSGNNNYYSILVIVATVCYATNVNLIKKYLSNLTPLTITTGNFTVMLVPALLILGFSGFFDVWHQPEVQESALFIIVLGVVGTGIANIIFFKLIQISSPVFATSVTYLIPVVAFFWGLLNNEMLTPLQILGAFIILAGVYLSSRK